VRRLYTSAGKTVHLGDVVQQHHRTDQLLGAVADGEADSSMERSLPLRATAAGRAAQVDGRAAGERLMYRIGEQPRSVSSTRLTISSSTCERPAPQCR